MGIGIGLGIQSALVAVLLGIAGLVVGALIDSLHAEPDLPPEVDVRERVESTRRRVEARRPPLERPAQPRPQLAGRAEGEEQERQQEIFSKHLCVLFVEVARADGEVRREEVRVVRQYFEVELGYGARAMQRVRNQLKAAIESPQDAEKAAVACAAELDDTSKFLLLDALYSLALVDGELRKSERDALRRVAAGLGISAEEHRSITHRHLGDGEAHYAVLGLEATAPDDELKSAFRRLAAQHHPDKVAHLGQGAVDSSTRRFREIQDAYEALRKLRNF